MRMHMHRRMSKGAGATRTYMRMHMHGCMSEGAGATCTYMRMHMHGCMSKGAGEREGGGGTYSLDLLYKHPLMPTLYLLYTYSVRAHMLTCTCLYLCTCTFLAGEGGSLRQQSAPSSDGNSTCTYMHVPIYMYLYTCTAIGPLV